MKGLLWTSHQAWILFLVDSSTGSWTGTEESVDSWALSQWPTKSEGGHGRWHALKCHWTTSKWPFGRSRQTFRTSLFHCFLSLLGLLRTPGLASSGVGGQKTLTCSIAWTRSCTAWSLVAESPLLFWKDSNSAQTGLYFRLANDQLLEPLRSSQCWSSERKLTSWSQTFSARTFWCLWTLLPGVEWIRSRILPWASL